jgi:hypothetical protein
MNKLIKIQSDGHACGLLPDRTPKKPLNRLKTEYDSTTIDKMGAPTAHMRSATSAV